MTQILDGKKLAEKILKKLQKRVENMAKKGINPFLVVISVGRDKASQIYLAAKKKACQEVGIPFEILNLKEDIQTAQLLRAIEKFNLDPKISSVLVQLPLPEQINLTIVAKKISPEKDVDGFGYIIGKKNFKFLPPTPLGILRILKEYLISLKDKKIVIIGKGFLVGKPLGKLLKKTGAKVVFCDRETKDLKQKTLASDILICATGRANIIRADMIKSGVVVIDAGALLAEVDFQAVSKKARAITPVPGGVGPMTVAMLLENVVLASQKSKVKR